MINEMFQKEDVMPYMRGMWQDALISVCGVDRAVFSGKHQACPSCGGKDRFRWTDKLQEPGDGGAFCNSCGGDKGIGWLMRLTGESYSECVNILGRYLGKVPQEYVIKQNKKAHRDTGFNHGKQAPHEKCMEVLNRTKKSPVSALARFESFGVESFEIGDETKETKGDDYYNLGVRSDGYEFHVVPCAVVYAEGPDSEYSNLMMIGEAGEVSYLAGGPTLAAVAVIGSSEKAIYLVESWIDGMHVHASTGQEVWVCSTAPNIEIVAFRYKGPRELRVACRSGDTDALCSADERQLKVVIPNGHDFKSGVKRELFNACDLLTN